MKTFFLILIPFGILVMLLESLLIALDYRSRIRIEDAPHREGSRTTDGEPHWDMKVVRSGKGLVHFYVEGWLPKVLNRPKQPYYLLDEEGNRYTVLGIGSKEVNVPDEALGAKGSIGKVYVRTSLAGAPKTYMGGWTLTNLRDKDHEVLISTSYDPNAPAGMPIITARSKRSSVIRSLLLLCFFFVMFLTTVASIRQNGMDSNGIIMLLASTLVTGSFLFSFLDNLVFRILCYANETIEIHTFRGSATCKLKEIEWEIAGEDFRQGHAKLILKVPTINHPITVYDKTEGFSDLCTYLARVKREWKRHQFEKK